jgi:hypothetical protein
MLGMVTQTVLQRQIPDAYIVPVTINYEKVLEIDKIVHELKVSGLSAPPHLILAVSSPPHPRLILTTSSSPDPHLILAVSSPRPACLLTGQCEEARVLRRRCDRWYP